MAVLEVLVTFKAMTGFGLTEWNKVNTLHSTVHAFTNTSNHLKFSIIYFHKHLQTVWSGHGVEHQTSATSQSKT